MACEQWAGKLDAYLDGELDAAESRALGEHLRGCAACAAAALERVQLKRAVQIAGKRYTASAELRQRIAMGPVTPYPGGVRYIFGRWRLAAVPVFAAAMVAAALSLYQGHQANERHRAYGELADLHIAALASANPVDVVSTDRHTVKPWFQGKIPFTFNLPELQGTEFSLIGGRVTYVRQTSGAHLLFLVRKHQISVFIFPEQRATPALESGPVNRASFNVESWTSDGLQYFVVGDASADDIRALGKLLQDVNHS